MLNKTILISIVIAIALGMLATTIINYAISKENKRIAFFTLFLYEILASGMYFYAENKVAENYIKENQVNTYMSGELVSENFNIYRIKIDGKDIFLEKR